MKPGRPLRRDTPACREFANSKSQLKRKKPMRKVSEKRRRPPSYPGWKLLDDRTAWGKEHPWCFICGSEGTEIHEICRRSQSPRGWAHRCNYFRVCSFGCHRLVEDYAQYPLVRQLVIKALRDPDNFDLDAWLLLRGRGAESVSFRDLFFGIIAHLRTCDRPPAKLLLPGDISLLAV